MLGGDYDERMGARRERAGYRVSVAGGRCVRKGPAADTCQITCWERLRYSLASESQALRGESKSNGAQSQELVLVECDWLAKVELLFHGCRYASSDAALCTRFYRLRIYFERIWRLIRIETKS